MTEVNPLYNLIISILDEPGKRNHTNKQYGFNCPVCSSQEGVDNDKKYNLEVNLNKNLMHCWKCEQSGSLRKLVKKYGNKIQLKLYDSLVDYDSDNTKEKTIKQGPLYLPKELIFFKDANKNDLSYKESYNYLINRGLDDEIIYKYNMGYCLEGKYQNRIIIPSYDINNKLNYFVARSFNGHKIKYLNPVLPKMDIIINEKNINWDGGTIFICEGVFDLIALYPLINVIPLAGKIMSDYLYYFLLKKCIANIIIILDSDAKIDSYKIYKKLHTTTQLKDKIRIVDLPNNSDLSDIRRDFGREGIIEILKTNHQLKLFDFMKYNI